MEGNGEGQRIALNAEQEGRRKGGRAFLKTVGEGRHKEGSALAWGLWGEVWGCSKDNHKGLSNAGHQRAESNTL